jgi:hypothetical protein
LDHYLISIHRKETARKRIPQDKLISLEDSTFGDLPEVAGNLDSDEVFNYSWVCELLDRMLEEVETECRHNSMEVHWDMFNDRVLHPILASAEPLSLEELCRKYGIDATTRASSMIFAVKRRFQSAAKRLLRESVASEQEIDEEMLELMKFLAKGR